MTIKFTKVFQNIRVASKVKKVAKNISPSEEYFIMI